MNDVLLPRDFSALSPAEAAPDDYLEPPRADIRLGGTFAAFRELSLLLTGGSSTTYYFDPELAMLLLFEGIGTGLLSSCGRVFTAALITGFLVFISSGCYYWNYCASATGTN